VLTVEFRDRCTLHWDIERLESSAAGIDLVVIDAIGELFEDPEQVLIPRASPDLHVSGATVRIKRLNRVGSSPLLGLGYS